MIRAVATRADGTKLLLLGVDERNVERLKAGKPIMVEGGPLGLPNVAVAIMYGETMQAIIDELKEAGISVPDHVPDDITPGNPAIFVRKP